MPNWSRSSLAIARSRFADILPPLVASERGKVLAKLFDGCATDRLDGSGRPAEPDGPNASVGGAGVVAVHGGVDAFGEDRLDGVGRLLDRHGHLLAGALRHPGQHVVR